jgi:SprB repeat
MFNKNLTGFAAIRLVALWFLFGGCSSVNEPEPIDCANSSLTVNFIFSAPTSCSATDGSITVTAMGGKQPYQYSIDTKPAGINRQFSGLGAGTYQIKLKDANGCERIDSVTLKSVGSSLAFTVQTTNSNCKTNTGAITINATGGSGLYSFIFNNGSATIMNSFSSLSAGSYPIVVSDGTGCSITKTITVLTDIKFSTDVKSIINTNCAIAGCHVAGGSGPGNFAIFANIQASAFAIHRVVQSGNMPKNAAKLPQAQLDAIACWVDDGAPNN